MAVIESMTIEILKTDGLTSKLTAPMDGLEPEEMQSLASSMVDGLLAEEGLIKLKGNSDREGVLR